LSGPSAAEVLISPVIAIPAVAQARQAHSAGASGGNQAEPSFGTGMC
jgi:hypothetical protein